MSFAATRWAWSQATGRSSSKLVLLALSDQAPGFHAEVVCRFAGVPGEYLIASREHLAELARDPVGFAADLAGLTRQQYLRRLLPGGES